MTDCRLHARLRGRAAGSDEGRGSRRYSSACRNSDTRACWSCTFGTCLKERETYSIVSYVTCSVTLGPSRWRSHRRV
eukprot:356295-Chlamydomonas_euryale.AAC.21